MRLVFDIETDNLLDKMTKLHCIVAKDLDTGSVYTYGPGLLEQGLDLLQRANVLVAHNGIDFDVPALEKLYPGFQAPDVIDTLVLSRLIHADIKDKDFVFAKKNDKFPKNLIGSHGLKAWGYRLGNLKDEYTGGFENFSEEMLEYCVQDVEVTEALYNKLMDKEPSLESVALEHAVAEIIRRQEHHGFAFDVGGARHLYTELCGRRDSLRRDLADAFPPWVLRTPFTPKRDNKTRGYKAGVTIYKEKEVTFNPDSRDHIAQKLKEKYDWKPTEFTPEGRPKVDETVLSQLQYPEAKLLAEHFLLTKRLGQLSEGPQAWIKKEVNGRIHGRVNTNGAVTGRMTHSQPNIAQVPSSGALYGEECRRLFRASEGFVLVGCDADSLEGRCLAGYMHRWDNGAFANIILKGDKDAATDLHSVNARLLGCSRDEAKTWFYAFLYGAGAAKLGSILSEGSREGARRKSKFLKQLPALGSLVGAVERRLSSVGYLRGLDGRRLPVRSVHSALNTLLQSAGAVLMKRALVILDEDLRSRFPGEYEFVANVHDEWQIETKPEIADEVGRMAVAAIRKAGEYYEFGCPLDGNYIVGETWADTH